MFTTIISGRVQYYGSDFKEATRVFTDRQSTEKAQLLTVRSLDEAQQMAGELADLSQRDADEVDRVIDGFSEGIVDACEYLVDSLDKVEVEEFTKKVQQNAEEIAQKVKRFGSDITRVIGEGFEKLGKGIKDTTKP